MQLQLIILAVALLIVGTYCNDWSYSRQDLWGKHCKPSSKWQSPINIEAKNMYRHLANNSRYLRSRSLLTQQLRFGGDWNRKVKGTVKSIGNTLKFYPSSNRKATLKTYDNYGYGYYNLKEFHFHWPRSEHVVNNVQYDGEIHFVHELNPNKDANQDRSSYAKYAVVAVLLCKDDTMRITGTWKQLYQKIKYGLYGKKQVNNIRYQQLLPKPTRDYQYRNGARFRSYFHYQGSLTTPGCDQIVHWFVLRNPVRVPGKFIKALEKMRDKNGNFIHHNWRNLQWINSNRPVHVFPPIDKYKEAKKCACN